MASQLKPGNRGFQAGTLSNVKSAGQMAERMAPILTKTGRWYAIRRDW